MGVNGRVHKTTDGGQSWSIVAQVNHDYADKLIMEDDNTGYLSMRNHYASGAGEDGRGFIYKTENCGETWNLEWTGPWPKSSISGLAFQFPGKLWACGAHNTIIERISGTTGFREVTVSPSNLIISPNPFTYDVKISYQIDKLEKIKVQLFDISGQLITTLVNENKNEGKYEVYWNGKDELGASLPDGLYFCTLPTGSKVWTK
ncbi:MAG: T9SS type A sorting domain-containing protein [Bacteroidales bacterium]|nr:T9SS type A sorting domain-containing protein [Bacteroidales bacterium]